MKNFDITYEIILNHSNFLYSSFKLIEINLAFIHHIEVFELFAQEYLVVDVLIVLLTNFVSKLPVKSIGREERG
jgi:hypothetical protein